MSNPQGIAAVILCGISFVLAVVATAIPFWIYGSVGDTWVSEGLWQSCGHIYDNTECLGLTERSTGIVLPGLDWVKAVRALEILGVLFIGGAGLCGFLKLFVMKTQDSLPKIAAAIGVTAGVLMLIGAIVYGVEFAQTFPSNSVIHLFVGFGLAIVAGVFSIIAGVLFAVAGNRQM